MAIDNNEYTGDTTFFCDGNSAACIGERVFDNGEEFDETIQTLKDEGWRIQREEGGWCHYCPECCGAINDFAETYKQEGEF